MDGWTDGQFDSSLRVLHQFQAVRLWISSLVITPPLLSLMTSCQFSTIRDQCSASTSHFYPILLERSHCLPALTAALTSAASLVPCLITIHKQYTTSGHLWAEHHIVGCIFCFFFLIHFSCLAWGVGGLQLRQATHCLLIIWKLINMLLLSKHSWCCLFHARQCRSILWGRTSNV